MRYLASRSDLLVEALEPTLMARCFRRQELERDGLAEGQVGGTVDRAHASPSQKADDAVASSDESSGDEAAFVGVRAGARLTAGGLPGFSRLRHGESDGGWFVYRGGDDRHAAKLARRRGSGCFIPAGSALSQRRVHQDALSLKCAAAIVPAELLQAGQGACRRLHRYRPWAPSAP